MTARVDSPFFGRCARQGDPGSCEAIVSLEDEIFLVHASAATRVIKHFGRGGARLHAGLYAGLRRLAQFRAERRSTYVRVQNLAHDRRLERMLAFSGRGE